MSRAALITLVAIALLTSIPAAEQGRCFALLIGINEYLDDAKPAISDLQCTQADCLLIAGMLEKLTGVEPARHTIVQLLDSEATKINVVSALDDFAQVAGSQDTLLVYFSGHGALVPDYSGDEPAGDGALIMHDFARNDRPPTEEEVSSGSITDDEMAAILHRFAPLKRVFYIADCCHSGGNERNVSDTFDKGFDLPLSSSQQLASGAKAILPLQDMNRLEQSNIVAIFACDSKQKAQEIRSVGHGAMTSCLGAILDEPATYDADLDGSLELEELALGLRSLVAETVRDFSGGAKSQTSYVKFIEAGAWSLGVESGSVNLAAESSYEGVAEEQLIEVIDAVYQRNGRRYDTGDEAFELLGFSFLDEDGLERLDNVYQESELILPGNSVGATLDWSFSLDAPANVIALIVFADGSTYTAFPNSPAMIANSAVPVTKLGAYVAQYPFTIPSAEYFGNTRFVLQMPVPGWEYIVLICSPTPLDDPHGQGNSAFDLIYPFGSLADSVTLDMEESQKGFGDSHPAIDEHDDSAELVPGKKLTIFYEKYWLVK